MRSTSTKVNGGFCLALTTAPGLYAARRIARALVADRLAACVNLVPVSASLYRWKGKVREDREVLLVLKTTAARRKALLKKILAIHPYDLPEILFLPVSGGHAAYLDWVAGETRPPQASRRKRR